MSSTSRKNPPLPPVLTKTEKSAFLSKPLIAKVATLRKDGSPQITPVWFDYEDDSIYFVTSPHNEKSTNIRRDSRVAICIESPDGRIAVLFDGTAEFVERDPEQNMAMMRKYVRPERIDAVLASYSEYPEVTIRVKPKKVISWDYAKQG